MIKYLLAVIALAAVIACMDGSEGDLFKDSFEKTTDISGTWHDRYIEDNCNRCPECCVVEDFGKYDDPNWEPEEYPCSERSPRSNCFEEPGWLDDEDEMLDEPEAFTQFCMEANGWSREKCQRDLQEKMDSY